MEKEIIFDDDACSSNSCTLCVEDQQVLTVSHKNCLDEDTNLLSVSDEISIQKMEYSEPVDFVDEPLRLSREL